MELRSQATTAQQVITLHLINMLTRCQVEFGIKLQFWCSCAIEVVVLARWNHHNLFLDTQGEWLVIGELEIDIILLKHIQEDTAKLVFHSSTWSNHPILLYHSTGRAVKTHVKWHVCLSTTIVGNNKFQLIVTTLYIREVQAEPLFTFRNIHAVPIEVNSLRTCIIYNVFGLIHLSRQCNLFARGQLQIHLFQSQGHQLLQRHGSTIVVETLSAPQLIILSCNVVARSLIYSLPSNTCL